MSLSQLRRIRWGVRAILTLGVAASVAANILHAERNPISETIAAWPPCALLLTIELVSRVPLRRGWASAGRIAATTGIAGIAAWVSYWHMAGVASRYGEARISAYLLPVSVDGLIVVASISLVELAGRLRALQDAELPVPAVRPLPVPAASVPAAAEQSRAEGATDARLHPAPVVDERNQVPTEVPEGVPAELPARRRVPVPDRRILAALRDPEAVPRRPDGTVAVREVERRWGVRQERAVRLLREAGLYRAGEGEGVPADELQPVPA